MRLLFARCNALAMHSQRVWTRPALVRATAASLSEQQRATGPFQSCPLSFQTNYSNYRCLSNAANPQLVMMMRSKAQAIVERTPIGDLDVDTWLDTRKQLLWWAKQRTPQSVRISFLLLERLVSEQQTLSSGGNNDVSSFLNDGMINDLVLNWREVFKQSPNNAKVFSPERLLFELDELCAKSPSLHMTVRALCHILDATLHLCKQGNSSFEVAAFCEVLWERMVQLRDGRYKYWCFLTSFNSVLTAWGTCARPDRAQLFLDRVPHDVVTPDSQSYTILLSAYSKLGDGPAAERVLELICRQWQDGVIQCDERSFRRDLQMNLTWVFWAWKKSSSPDAASRVLALLSRMYDPSNAPSIQPSLSMFNAVLFCWSRSSWKDGPDLCRGLLKQMKHLYATGELESPPDLSSYAPVIEAYATAGEPSNAEVLFQEMYLGFMRDGHAHLKPDLRTLTVLLRAWGLSGDVERAWAAFGRIRELHDLGVIPTGLNSATYNIMISCLLNCDKALPDCAVKADTLLQEIKKKPKIEPDIRLYAYALQAWLLTPDGLDRAFELAREAMGVCCAQPDRRFSKSVHAIILAFCTAGHPVQAQAILFEVCELVRENRGLHPDVDLFLSLVDAWRKSEDPEAVLKVEELLKRMKQLPSGG
jgi:hypothetical protein